MILRLYDEQNE